MKTATLAAIAAATTFAAGITLGTILRPAPAPSVRSYPDGMTIEGAGGLIAHLESIRDRCRIIETTGKDPKVVSEARAARKRAEEGLRTIHAVYGLP